MDNFRMLGKIGEGTFSDVLKIQSLIDGKYYACKRMKQKYSSMDQVNNLREVQALRRLSPHPHILELKQVVFDPHTGVLSLICELMDMNAYELIKDRKSFLSEQRVKLFMYQLCKALYHLHRQFHRANLSMILPEVQDGNLGDRQQPANPTEGERLLAEGNESSASAKQVTLPELVAKSPPPWPGLVEKKQPEFYKNVSSGKVLPGIHHHQRKHQIPSTKLHKPHHKAPKPHFLLPLNHKNNHP